MVQNISFLKRRSYVARKIGPFFFILVFFFFFFFFFLLKCKQRRSPGKWPPGENVRSRTALFALGHLKNNSSLRNVKSHRRYVKVPKVCQDSEDVLDLVSVGFKIMVIHTRTNPTLIQSSISRSPWHTSEPWTPPYPYPHMRWDFPFRTADFLI